jgi:hypothetical protein
MKTFPTAHERQNQLDKSIIRAIHRLSCHVGSTLNYATLLRGGGNYLQSEWVGKKSYFFFIPPTPPDAAHRRRRRRFLIVFAVLFQFRLFLPSRLYSFVKVTQSL